MKTRNLLKPILVAFTALALLVAPALSITSALAHSQAMMCAQIAAQVSIDQADCCKTHETPAVAQSHAGCDMHGESPSGEEPCSDPSECPCCVVHLISIVATLDAPANLFNGILIAESIVLIPDATPLSNDLDTLLRPPIA